MGPAGLHVSGDESYLAILGGVLAPLFLPLGFGTWQAASSLVVGFLAKNLWLHLCLLSVVVKRD